MISIHDKIHIIEFNSNNVLNVLVLVQISSESAQTTHATAGTWHKFFDVDHQISFSCKYRLASLQVIYCTL